MAAYELQIQSQPKVRRLKNERPTWKLLKSCRHGGGTKSPCVTKAALLPQVTVVNQMTSSVNKVITPIQKSAIVTKEGKPLNGGDTKKVRG